MVTASGSVVQEEAAEDNAESEGKAIVISHQRRRAGTFQEPRSTPYGKPCPTRFTAVALHHKKASDA